MTIFDPTRVWSASGRKDGEFFYQLSDDKSHYFLRGLGPDGVPFTADDLLPGLQEAERSKTGLLLEKPKDTDGFAP